MSSPGKNSGEGYRWRRLGLLALRWVIALIVAFGVGRRMWFEREKLAGYALEPNLPWLVVAAVAYVAGLSTCAGFWRLTLRDRGYRPSWASTWAAYFAGHLGKYVPGKGMVLVVRAGMMRGEGVDLATGALTCLQETVVMMATGSGLALVLFLGIDTPHRWVLTGLAAALFVLLGTLGIPPVVARLGQLARLPVDPAVPESKHGGRWSTLFLGVAMIVAGWFLMGSSLAGVVAGLGWWAPFLERYGVLGSMRLLTAAVALATVGGFVSMLPGGIGSREWILVETLGPALGGDRAADAAVIAIALRLVWIAAEVAGTAVFWIIDRLCKKRIQSN